MKQKNNCSFWLAGVLACLAFVSCRQDEYMPPQIGEAIPYQEERTLNEVLDSLGNHELFYAMWNGSSFADSLNAIMGGSAQFTLFAPSDEALELAGYRMETIRATSREELDRLLKYYIAGGIIDSSLLEEGAADALEVRSMASLTGVFESIDMSSPTYRFRHHLSLTQENQLVMDSQNVGEFQSIAFKAGRVVPIDRFFPLQMVVADALKADGRFSIFLRITEINDSIYNERTSSNLSSWFNTMGRLDPAANENRSHLSIAELEAEKSSFFIPTDEAFEKAGITLNDLISMNNEYVDAVGTLCQYYTSPDLYPYTYYEFLKSDSILSYHTWCKTILPYGGTMMYSTSYIYSTYFQLDELTNENLSDYILCDQYSTGYYQMLFGDNIFYQPFFFGKDEQGRVTIRLKADPDAEPATVIDEMSEINGNIFVVDRLFIPQELQK